MPTYTYQCACGVQFDQRAPIADRRKAKSCPSCGEEAPPIPPATVSGQFTKSVTGPMPQNTGIHDLDTHIDRVIGQSSAQGWDVAEARKRQKEEVMASAGVDGHQLSRQPDGSYGVLRPEERAVHERAQKIHQKAGEWKRKETAGR